MGKHERQEVFFAEQTVDLMLNKVPVSTQRQRHHLFKCSEALVAKIRADFPSMKGSHHIGNVYGSSIGDIKLMLPAGEEAYLELKFLASGGGTRANIGQDSLTDFSLFQGASVVPWSRFRDGKGHQAWVERELDRFDNYPRAVKSMGGMSGVYGKAGYLKNHVLGITKKNTMGIVEDILASRASAEDELKAATIIKSIVERDRAEKLEYIEYLETLSQNHDNIKKFLFLILAGAHSHDSLKALWHESLNDIVRTLRSKYYVYYVYKHTLETKVEDYSEKLSNLVTRVISVSFKPQQTSVMLSCKDSNGSEISILRVVFHWKNKFQGIKTPCLNVFDERYLTQNLNPRQWGTAS